MDNDKINKCVNSIIYEYTGVLLKNTVTIGEERKIKEKLIEKLKIML